MKKKILKWIGIKEPPTLQDIQKLISENLRLAERRGEIELEHIRKEMRYNFTLAEWLTKHHNIRIVQKMVPDERYEQPEVPHHQIFIVEESPRPFKKKKT